jgi:hypothetical protein
MHGTGLGKHPLSETRNPVRPVRPVRPVGAFLGAVTKQS